MAAASLYLKPLAREAHIQRVVALETASYPADEAASETRIRYRQQHAGAFFQAAFLSSTEGADDDEKDVLVGFVNGTLSASNELEEHSMSSHDPAGTTLCIQSVVVDAAYRRQGLAKVMLKQYVREIVEQQHRVKRIALIAKAHLVGFYVSCGFAVTKLSPVVHGKDPWFELVLDCVAARQLKVVQVDAFSSEIFQGNPAAVVIMPPSEYHKPTVTQWMQRMAMENNVSETAYVARRPSTGDIAEYDLRWFSPEVEVQLCGHATLSSAFVLYEDGHVPPTSTIHFHTLSGVLVCKLEKSVTGNGNETRLIQMEFPLRSLHPVAEGITTEALASGLGISPSNIVEMKQTPTTHLLVRTDPSAFASLKPDFQKLGAVEASGIMVTAESLDKSSGVDFQSRYFGPRVGINEDPVTGSAHCALATYWSEQLQKKHIYAKQACPARGGCLTLELLEDRPGRLLIKGEAIISLRGVLYSRP